MFSITITFNYCFLFFDEDLRKAGFAFCNPIVIYENVNVNWFGAIFLALLANIFFLPAAIVYWIYKLCAVGRKEEE